MNLSFTERVYESMTCELLDGFAVPGVEYAFEEGSYCMDLYSDAYNAYRRLCHRLNSGDEDPDIEIIFRSFLKMQEELCFRMYRYGVQFGDRDA